MPVTKQARKKLRKDLRREKKNAKLKANLKKIIKKTKKSPTIKHLSLSSKVIDKAAKKNVIHKNKASRLKSRLARLSKSK
ncbi:MAG: 30S ribosomal protein S20 [Candidatus Levybacteria bacterium]|nr:30S ribosomal protein S20 [Candidatus Levybacteria bacterium]